MSSKSLLRHLVSAGLLVTIPHPVSGIVFGATFLVLAVATWRRVARSRIALFADASRRVNSAIRYARLVVEHTDRTREPALLVCPEF